MSQRTRLRAVPVFAAAFMGGYSPAVNVGFLRSNAFSAPVRCESSALSGEGIAHGGGRSQFRRSPFPVSSVGMFYGL
jgi:hypothetical protein